MKAAPRVALLTTAALIAIHAIAALPDSRTPEGTDRDQGLIRPAIPAVDACGSVEAPWSDAHAVPRARLTCVPMDERAVVPGRLLGSSDPALRPYPSRASPA